MKPTILSEYAGTLSGTSSIDVYAAVTLTEPDEYGYNEQVGDLSTTYTASSLEELLGKVDHMLLASEVVKQAMSKA